MAKFNKSAIVAEVGDDGEETGSQAYAFVVDADGGLKIEQKKISLGHPRCKVEDAIAALHHLHGGPADAS